jgi:hypothetical protein
MSREEVQHINHPMSALEGTWPLDEWPIDVQRVDENGVDLSLIEYTLAQSPAERLTQLEGFVEAILAARKAGGVEWSTSESSFEG